nr:acyl-homoserine-lactone synthase [uncultured Acetobacter sp.]
MVYEFSYKEREQYFSVYEKMLASREYFFEWHPEWHGAFEPTPAEDDLDRLYNPFYIVAVDDTEEIIASVRILPTTGPTLLRQKFARFFKACPDIISPDVWEASYFSTTADTSLPAGRSLVVDMLKAVYECAFSSGVSQIIGTYPRSKLRLYRRLNCSPVSVCSGDINGQEFCVGVWDITPLLLRHLVELQLRPF